MSWDLMHGGILKGKTPSEVEELLGEPMMKDTFRSDRALPMFDSPHAKRGVETWYYSLGNELYDSGLGPSGAVLAVDFRKDKVFDVRKVIH
jgi:outer membrane protein assembly factor BamE (lipoprotein component of BamABCDE complex)